MNEMFVNKIKAGFGGFCFFCATEYPNRSHLDGLPRPVNLLLPVYDLMKINFISDMTSTRTKAMIELYMIQKVHVFNP